MQIFENTHEIKSIAATNAFIGCSTSDRNKSIVISSKRISSDVRKEVVAKKVRGNTSEVWNHYENIGLVDGVEKCKCEDRGKLYTCNSDNGITHLRRHVQKCHLIPKNNDVGVMLVDHSEMLRPRNFIIRLIKMHSLDVL